MTNARVGWIDVAKGLCIVAVVSLYAVERVEAGAEDWMQRWAVFARPFRMPDFFLISGLFLGRVLDRPWRDYLDKKVVHYLYFFVLWSLIYFPFLALAGRAGSTPAEALAQLARMAYEPYAMLWFVQMLAVYFVLTRLLRPAPVWAVLAGAALWQMLPAHSGWEQLDRAGERFVYFYAGYAFAPRFFRLADWAAGHRRAASAGLAVWAAANGALVWAGLAGKPGVALALGLAGSAAVIAMSSLLYGTRLGGWLAYCGRRSIAIYLSFLIPMTALLLLFEKTGRPLDEGALAALIAAASVAACLVFDRAVAGTRLSWLFERPSWAVLPELRARRLAAAQPDGAG